MEIKANEIQGETPIKIMIELCNKNELIDFCRGHNLRTGDAIEAIALDIACDGNDVDVNNYLHIR